MKRYTPAEARELVEEAVNRSKQRHLFWSQLENLFRTGSMGGLTQSSLTGTLFDFLSPADLETVNLVLPRVRLQVARLTARDPRPVAQAQAGGPDAELIEGTVEAVLEYFWNRQFATSVVRDMAQDVVVLGNGFAKVGWSYSETEVPLTDEEIAEQEMYAVEVERQSAIVQGRQPRPLAELDPVETSTTYIEEDEPYIKYVRPYDIFTPASARRLEDSRWIAQRVLLPLDEAQERYPGYKFVATQVTDDMHLSSEQMGEHADDVVELFEFWDSGTRNLKVLVADNDKPVFDGEWPHSHRYAPFVHIANHRARPSDFWGFGDLQSIAPLQAHFNSVWTTIIDSTYRSGRKYLALKGTLDEEAISVLESDADDAIVFIDGAAGEHPANLVAPLYRQPISQEVLHAGEKLVELMDSVLAHNDFDSGGVGADRMSATAAAAVLGVAEERSSDRQLLLEEGCSRIFTLLLLLTQEFMTSETAVRIAGANGSVWQSATGEMLIGEYQIRVETGSMNGETRAMRRSEGVQLLTQVVPALASLGYDVDGVIRSALKRMSYDPEELGVRKLEPAAPEAPAGQPPVPMTGEVVEGATGLSMPAELQARGGF